MVYYRNPDPSTQLSDELISRCGHLLVDLSAPNARFTQIAGSSSRSFNSLDEMAEALDLSDEDRSKCKREVLELVRELFGRLEKDYPDSSTGVAGFMSGGDYRTPFHDGFYEFHIEAIFKDHWGEYVELNPAIDYSFHVSNSLSLEWPFIARVTKKCRGKQAVCEYDLDIFYVVDLLLGLCGRLDCTDTIYRTDGTEESVTIQAFPEHNLVKVHDSLGTIRLNHERFIEHFVNFVRRFLMRLEPNTTGEVAANFLHLDIDMKRRISKPFDRILDTIGFWVPGLDCPTDSLYVCMVGIEVFLSINPHLKFSELPPRMWPIIECAFNHVGQGHLDQFLDEVRENWGLLWGNCGDLT